MTKGSDVAEETVEEYIKRNLEIMLDNALWTGGARCFRHRHIWVPCVEDSQDPKKTWCFLCGLDPLDMNLNLQPVIPKYSQYCAITQSYFKVLEGQGVDVDEYIRFLNNMED